MRESTKWGAAKLRISSDQMSAAEMTSVLGVEPSQSHNKGEPRSVRSSVSTPRDRSLWLLASGLDSRHFLDEHIEELLEKVEPMVSKLELLRSRCTIDIFCGFFAQNGQGSFELKAEILRRLAALSLDLVLDLYPPTGPEED